ncbi:hypothetical protein RND81_06G049300 [Saponaria officinalis]|uniref:Uncharacterized protein n=1 Tax=Saponaria officinalis TaxID=3572 RepID=A0AAW1K628_SAPOF
MKQNLMEEFTFPINEQNNYSPIDSPPLWQLSPTASPTPSYGVPRSVLAQNCVTWSPSKACSYNLEGMCFFKRSKMEENDDEKQEDKMDELWEDLNEEMFCKNRANNKIFELHNNNNHKNNNDNNNNFSKGGDEMVQFGCVNTSFKMVNDKNNNINNSNIYNNKNVNNRGGVGNLVKRNKKASMVVLMKVLRKFFVLQQLSIKKRSR